MSISQITHNIADRRRQLRDARELDRAIHNASTPACRQELEMLARR